MREHIVTRKQREGPRDIDNIIEELRYREHEEDTVAMDYLEEARHSIERARLVPGVGGATECALVAIACALVAQAELLTALLARLDTVIDGEDNTLYVTLMK